MCKLVQILKDDHDRVWLGTEETADGKLVHMVWDQSYRCIALIDESEYIADSDYQIPWHRECRVIETHPEALHRTDYGNFEVWRRHLGECKDDKEEEGEEEAPCECPDCVNDRKVEAGEGINCVNCGGYVDNDSVVSDTFCSVRCYAEYAVSGEGV